MVGFVNTKEDCVYIITGLPRSGTSMMMRMLAAAFFPIVKDDKREADVDNPHGYFEVDMIINKLRDDPSFIYKCLGRCVKVINYGVKYLPTMKYKAIYMSRNIDEIEASMRKMAGNKLSDSTALTRDVLQTMDMWAQIEIRKLADVLIINYRDCIDNPLEIAEKVADHFGIQSWKHQNMANAIDASLYRNRVET